MTLILSLGIGVTTALFSLVEVILLRPAPWPYADRLVLIHAVRPDLRASTAFAGQWDRAPVSWASWQDLRRQSAFDEVAAWMPRQEILDEGDTVPVFHCSAAFPALLGLTPALGRFFTEEEDHQLDGEAVILGYETWQRRFSGRADVVGQRLLLAAGPSSPPRPRVVVGVLDRPFTFQGETPDLLVPLGPMSFNGSFESNRFLRVVGRLAADVSFASAASAVVPAIQRLEPPERRSARLDWLVGDDVRHVWRPLWLLLGGAALLLLVACASIAGLLLGRSRVRRHEMAVRFALGASRASAARQLGLEHLVIAVTAGAGGLALASWLIPALVTLSPYPIPSLRSAGISARVAGCALGLAAVTTVLFGLAPAVNWLATGPRDALSLGSRQLTSTHHAVHRGIVACALSLSLVLAVSAVLFGETVRRLMAEPLGFDPSGVVTMSVAYGTAPVPIQKTDLGAPREYRVAGTPDGAGYRAAYVSTMLAGRVHTAGLLRQLAALPDVIGAAASSAAPFTGGLRPFGIRRPPPYQSEVDYVQRQFVTPGYLSVLGIPIIRGRDFEPADAQRAPVVLVSREVERQLLGGDAVDRLLGPYRVIGVAGDVKQADRSDLAPLVVYVLNSDASLMTRIVVKTVGDPLSLLPLLRLTVEDYDRSTMVTTTALMEDRAAGSVAEERFLATLAGLFAAAALGLGSVGLFGLAARLVIDRSREIGVRVAFGATPRHVWSLVIRDVAVVVGLGAGAGLPLAYVASRLMQSLLFGVTPAAWIVYAAALVMLAAAASAAVVVPARRACRVDPAAALRE